MAEQFEVDAATLHSAASDVRSTRSDVDGDLGRLWNVVDDLAMAWKGDASTGFQQLMQRWNEDVTKLLTAMDDIADLLDKGGTTHQANDEQQAQMLNKYTSALNM
ncbi:WXG100 family type VII secretion target [Micromonospora sp. NPDC049559]|uniref:WXG100 family type VII secretion target n=1 Tax=Micromonospora sp. NPDC049559 TaxID=3155923 RepID=UPI003432B3D0